MRPRLLKIRGSRSPFVFIWDTDVAAIIQRAVTGSPTGIFNVAGDGAMTVDEIAAALGKPTIAIPEPVLRAGLAVGKRLGVTAYGPGADEVPPVPSRARQHPAQGRLRLHPVVHLGRGVRGVEAGASLVGPGTMVHMRAIWKGAVSFGLVSVPVKLYSATESKDISFRQVHAKDGGRIKYQRVCSLDGEEVEYADIAKGYETEDGEMVILTDEDMANLPSESSREISVEKFVPSEQIDPMLFEKCYYLEPEKTGAKPYALLREALEAADRMALVTVSLRNRMSLAVLRVRDDVIVMQTMMWPDEIRKPDFGSVDTSEAKPAEVKMATMLVDTLAGDFDADELRGRLPRGRRGAGQGQDRGRRGQAHPRGQEVLRRGRRPARSPAAQRRRGEDRARREARRLRRSSDDEVRHEEDRQEDRRQEVGGEEDHQEGREEDPGQEGQLTLSAPVAARSSARSCRSSGRPVSRSR